MPANEYLDPKERAKKFNKGSFTASQTGAKQEADRHFQNQTKANGGAVAANMEDVISGKKRNLP
jgi:hypothetical protein